MSLWAILGATWRRIAKDNLSALAAGAAFQALFAIFPTLTAVVSVYGLVADPSMVERQISAIQGVLPPEAVGLIATWLHALIQGRTAKFGIGLIVSVLFALWSMWSSAGMLMTAVNICYGEEERRGFVSFNLTALALGVGLALFGTAALALVAVLPAALALLPVPDGWGEVLGLLRWPIMAGLVLVALAIVYRYAPDRAEPRWQWLSWGAVAATALWILGSVGFTLYVAKIASYDKSYGSLGALIILLLWFYLTAYVILAGAELNAAIERHTRRAAPREAGGGSAAATAPGWPGGGC
ncbi:MAG TPA: YihY/virulence factor BrkB family protein [Stellaceae bacterium]|nr:YihY/virulence factor BrkB family protein [Stellaceae bacterium]